MPITLKIVSYQRLTPGQQETFSTDRNKISIGRNPENDLTLADPQRFMSGTHCWIENRGGTWYLTDTSTNGVFINGSDQRVAKGDSVALGKGDRLKLGDYELEFAEQTGTPAGGPFEDDDEDYFAVPEPGAPGRDSREDSKEANTPLSQMDSSLLGDSVSLDDLYDFDGEEEEEEPQSLSGREARGSPIHHHFSAPQVDDGQGGDLPDKYRVEPDAIPDNWDEETGMVKRPPKQADEPAPAAPADDPVEIPDDWDEETGIAEVEAEAPSPPPAAQRPAPPPAAERPAPRAPAPRIQADSAIAAFVQGAGLDRSQLKVDDEAAFFHELGALLRTMTAGIMQAIASRSQIKSEFRLEQTMIAPTENNPLKFSATAEEALLRLVRHSEKAYLAGADAAREAIDDINAHQMAVLAGTEAALRSILRRFKPDSLEARLGGGSAPGNLIPLFKKAKYWDFFKALYEEVSEAADDDFHQFFGNEFAKAYEQQLERLRKSRKDDTV